LCCRFSVCVSSARAFFFISISFFWEFKLSHCVLSTSNFKQQQHEDFFGHIIVHHSSRIIKKLTLKFSFEDKYQHSISLWISLTRDNFKQHDYDFKMEKLWIICFFFCEKETRRNFEFMSRRERDGWRRRRGHEQIIIFRQFTCAKDEQEMKWNLFSSCVPPERERQSQSQRKIFCVDCWIWVEKEKISWINRRW
jgi:hypothetical protein